eukprot:6205438-Pleurochrysis_carterae.AAC.4
MCSITHTLDSFAFRARRAFLCLPVDSVRTAAIAGTAPAPSKPRPETMDPNRRSGAAIFANASPSVTSSRGPKRRDAGSCSDMIGACSARTDEKHVRIGWSAAPRGWGSARMPATSAASPNDLIGRRSRHVARRQRARIGAHLPGHRAERRARRRQEHSKLLLDTISSSITRAFRYITHEQFLYCELGKHHTMPFCLSSSPNTAAARLGCSVPLRPHDSSRAPPAPTS